MLRKLLFVHLLIIGTSISFAKNKVDTFQRGDRDFSVRNMHGSKSIAEVLESTDSVDPVNDNFEITIVSNAGEPELKCIIGADILKVFYDKKKSKYSGVSKERRYGDFIQDFVREIKLTRVEYKEHADKDKKGKE